MALSEHLPAPASWSRWPQHHSTSGDYAMMEHNVMPYESRQATAAPPQRPPLASQYFSSTPFSLAPITNGVPAPQYQPPVTYSGYHSYTPSPVLGSPFRANTYPEQQTRVMPVESGLARGSVTPHAGHSPVQENQSPSVKAERQLSIPAEVTMPCRTIEANLTVAGQQPHEFHTPLDTLMKAVQAKAEKPAECKTETSGTEAQDRGLPSSSQSQASTRTRRSVAGSGGPLKRYACGIAGCSKMFSQKTHLDTHRRAHTGESPYQCTLCGKDFTQPGNLKAHWRRHMGEKPFSCTLCDKRFPQRGNLQAHMKSHDKTRPFICLLDNCNKAFSVRGNLKSHQNKFHEDTIKRLTTRFATITDWSTASYEDKELFEYLSNLYKNSNKGIKGRGKRRNVAVVVSQHHQGHLSTPGSPTNSTRHHHPHQSPMHLHHTGLPQLQLCMPQPRHDGLPYHGVSSPAAYNMSSRPASLMVNTGGRRPHSRYGMYDTDESSVSSSGPVTPNPHMYGDNHGKDLAFNDRMPY
ncbi:DNA-binding transcription factor [Podospora bellae-mahoneyi]|uniref:DNA-binding transcription factor n=1 Tax=Podospora bellae-mahoneyi TaxID=2093777 RepID=A0ABR0FUJ8_9PEZI|nr:DNA-binding transcription factor [Podospora bellae-mahoneyi]